VYPSIDMREAAVSVSHSTDNNWLNLLTHCERGEVWVYVYRVTTRTHTHNDQYKHTETNWHIHTLINWQIHWWTDRMYSISCVSVVWMNPSHDCILNYYYKLHVTVVVVIMLMWLRCHDVWAHNIRPISVTTDRAHCSRTCIQSIDNNILYCCTGFVFICLLLIWMYCDSGLN